MSLNYSIIEQYTHVIEQYDTTGVVHMLLIRVVKPIHLEELFGEYRIKDDKNKEKTHLGKTYYFNGDEATYEPDDRTFVLSSSESRIRRLIESGPDPRPAFEQESAWQAVKRGQVALLINDPSQHAHVLTDVFPDGSRAMTPQEAFASSFLTLVKDVEAISAGVRWDGELSARAFAWLSNQQATDDLTDLLEGAEVLGRTWMLAPSATENGNPALLKVVRELFGALQISKDAFRVQVQTSIPVDRDRGATFAGEILAVRQAAKRAESVNNLKRLGLAMHNYHDVNKCFPPPVLLGPDGKTPYSWRVALLPYLQQQALYDAYDFNEPWDGPNNRKLAQTVVPVFRHPTAQGGTATSAYYALVGPETVFDGKKDRVASDYMGMGGSGSGQTATRKNSGVHLMHVRDGSSNTIMLVEAKRDIPWTKPEDIPYDAAKPLPELGGFFDEGFHAAVCDGSVRLIPADIAEDVLRAMISKAGGEVIDQF